MGGSAEESGGDEGERVTTLQLEADSLCNPHKEQLVPSSERQEVRRGYSPQIAEDFNVPAYWYALSMEDAWQHRPTNFRRGAALANSFYDTHSQEQRAYIVVVAILRIC